MIVQDDNLYLFWQTDSSFSNWTLSPYIHEGVIFKSSEHGMMYEKAKLFDPSMREDIVNAGHPRDVKALGRKIANFDPEVWDQMSVKLFVPHLVSKFTQNETFKAELLGTGDRVIAEASPYDKVWGIGLAPDNPKALIMRNWNGENRLGIALMLARDVINLNMSN